jgi:MtN3 and saliva related transmembrane protein
MLIGYIAAFLTTMAFVPQAIKTIKTKDTSGISLLTYILMTSGCVLWLAYGIMINDIPLIASNCVTVVLAATILYHKIIASR